MILFAALDSMLCVLFGVFACAWLVFRPTARVPRTFALRAVFFLWVSSFVPMLGESGDWLHLFWMAQVPMVGLFLLSGVFLFTSSRDEADCPEGQGSGALEKLVSSKRAPWWFFAMMASLGIAPLLLIAFSGDPPDGRNIGEPVRRVFELAQWGFGGALPECLGPLTFEEQARGVGHLPREVTVPVGSLLIAAWLWIAFCTLALVGRLVPWPRIRRVFLLLSPFFLGAVSLLPPIRARGPSWWFDPSLFWGDSYSGVWTSDPAVLRSFGPLLLAAVISAILLVILVRRKAYRVR